MRILMMAFCEHAHLRADGKLDVHGAFNDLTGEGPHPSFTINGETEVKPRASDDRPARTHLVMPLKDIVFPAPGAYRLELTVKGQTVLGPPLHLWEVADAAAH